MHIRQKRKFRFLQTVQDIMGALERWRFLEGLEELTRLYATTLVVKSSTQYTTTNKSIVLGAELLRREGNIHSVYMGVDKQAAIQAVFHMTCILVMTP